MIVIKVSSTPPVPISLRGTLYTWSYRLHSSTDKLLKNYHHHFTNEETEALGALHHHLTNEETEALVPWLAQVHPAG